MQPRFSVQIVAISLCLTVLACSHVAVDCADWNSKEYFEAATAADVAACIQSGADLKARTEDGWTPLHWAAGLNESPAIITALLDAGADPKARDKDGKTPLHWAAWSNEESGRHRGAPGRRGGSQGAAHALAQDCSGNAPTTESRSRSLEAWSGSTENGAFPSGGHQSAGGFSSHDRSARSAL